MDDEDLADAAEAQRLQTADAFVSLGSTEEDAAKRGTLVDLFKTEGETMGVALLKKMGWREGQGIGPKVRRTARLGGMEILDPAVAQQTHMFAPENTHLVSFFRKSGHKGLGFDGESKLVSPNPAKSDEEDEDGFGTKIVVKKKKKKLQKGGIGIGILNDTGSDDEDPYEIGPKISYNKVIGGDKKKKRPVVNGAIRPVFISKKAAIAKAGSGFRKCHDGRLPLDGFILSNNPDSISGFSLEAKYKPPKVPEEWKSSKTPSTSSTSSAYISTADAAKVSKLDPKSRATMLGEAPLPGKSVFDFLSTAARDRLAAASGKTNLPAALGEIPAGYSMTPEEREKELHSRVPKLDRDIAVAALARGASGWMPYAEDEAKRSRYRSFLEMQAGILAGLPEKSPGISKDDWMKELQEFAHCAQIFKPMTGMMANRFTSSSSAPKLASDAPYSADSLVSKPAPKQEDPAEAAAKVGMFGPMTRSSQNFYPTRLLCKRFNVKPPAHVQLDPERAAEDGGSFQASDNGVKDLDLVSKHAIDGMMKEHWENSTINAGSMKAEDVVLVVENKDTVVDAERNEALEGEKAGEAVFKAIFGDSDDED
jgi:G patch domain-containing protein 1